MEKFSGKFLGKDIVVEADRLTCIELLGLLGHYFDLDSQRNEQNTIQITDQEYSDSMQKWKREIR